MTFLSLSWLLFTVIMVAMVFLFGPHHPRVLNEYEPIGHERILIAVFALIMLVLCFTPVPLDVRILTGR
jgi:hypothetical protein